MARPYTNTSEPTTVQPAAEPVANPDTPAVPTDIPGTPPKVLNLLDLETCDTEMLVRSVAVPEWGGVVHVRRLTALERGQLDEVVYAENGKMKPEVFGPGFVAAALCDAAGKSFYKVGDLLAVRNIGAKSGTAVRRVYDEVAKLNGLRDDDLAAGKDGSGPAPDAASPSA